MCTAYDPSKGPPAEMPNPGNNRFANLYNNQQRAYDEYQSQQAQQAQQAEADRIAADRQQAIAETQRQSAELQRQMQEVAAGQARASQDFGSQRDAEMQRLDQAARDQAASYGQQRQALERELAEQRAAQEAELAKQQLNTSAVSQSLRVLGTKGSQVKAPAGAVTRGKKPLGVGGVATVSPTQSLRIGSTPRTAGVGTNLGV